MRNNSSRYYVATKVFVFIGILHKTILLSGLPLILPLYHPPLMQATIDSRVDLVQKLLCYGADVNQHDTNGRTVLTYAVRANNLQIIRLLLKDRSLMIDKADNRGVTPFIVAMERTAHINCMRLLLGAGANPEQPNRRQQTPLIKASISGYIGIVKELLSSRVDIHARDKLKHSALMWAIIQDNKTIAELLVKHGAGLTPQDFLIIDPDTYPPDSLYMKKLNETARQRSGLIEDTLYELVPRVLAVLIRQFETPVPSHRI